MPSIWNLAPFAATAAASTSEASTGGCALGLTAGTHRPTSRSRVNVLEPSHRSLLHAQPTAARPSHA